MRLTFEKNSIGRKTGGVRRCDLCSLEESLIKPRNWNICDSCNKKQAVKNGVRKPPPLQVKKQSYINFCQTCSKVFEIKSLAYRNQKYCSSSCYGQGVLTNKCYDCGVACKGDRCSKCFCKNWHATKGSSWSKNRRDTDLSYKLSLTIRSRIKSCLKTQLKRKRAKYKSIEANEALLGCSIEHLKNYLESKFNNGMSWDNYGHKGWHIDHIKPLSSFDLTQDEQLKQACHYTNLQPLWWMDNLRKHAKIVDMGADYELNTETR